jgi:ketosteroid isomerase-like protein
MPTPALAPLDVLLIERACERLVLDSVAANDRQDYDALAALFADDARLTRPSSPDPVVGRDDIVRSYRSRPPGRITRHVCTNVRIVVESADRARGTSYIMLFSADGTQVADGHFGVKADSRQLVGEFVDEFVRTTDGWRIAARRATFTLHASK